MSTYEVLYLFYQMAHKSLNVYKFKTGDILVDNMEK